VGVKIHGPLGDGCRGRVDGRRICTPGLSVCLTVCQSASQVSVEKRGGGGSADLVAVDIPQSTQSYLVY
jgi:hypothetical protein